MGEADLADGARGVGEQRTDGAVGAFEIAGQIAEQVEGEGRGPQQICPGPLVIEALVRLDDGTPRLRSGQRAVRQKRRAGLARIRERDPAPDESGRPIARPRIDRLRSDRVPVGLPPSCVVIAQPTSEIGHPGPTRDEVLRLPAVRRLKLFAGRGRVHRSSIGAA